MTKNTISQTGLIGSAAAAKLETGYSIELNNNVGIDEYSIVTSRDGKKMSLNVLVLTDEEFDFIKSNMDNESIP